MFRTTLKQECIKLFEEKYGVIQRLTQKVKDGQYQFEKRSIINNAYGDI